VESVPRWAVLSTFVLSLSGLAIATYLTIVHFDSSVVLACSSNPGISCEKVTTSAQSYFLGIPVSVLGLGQYVAMSVLNSPFAWRRPERWLHVARFSLAAVGFCFILWLIYAEVVIIGAICLWCSAVHLITVAILIILTRVEPAQLGWARSGELDSAEAH
jgi:uncharacterized membrane protein